MPNTLINASCNQRCEYCFAEDSMNETPAASVSMTLATYLRVLQFHAKHHYEEVRILWGEPFLHPVLATFVKLAIKGGFFVTLFSNVNFPKSVLERVFRDITSENISKIRINCNINNLDFYTTDQIGHIQKNISYLQEIGVDVTLGYNIYRLDKQPDDVLEFAKKCGISSVNLKITNSVLGKPQIIATGDRSYGEYIMRAVDRYHQDFHFFFSCGLSREIFSSDEIDRMEHQYTIPLVYGCDGFSGKFDIGPSGEIFHCFPLKQLYQHRNISIDSLNPANTDLYAIAGITPSCGECLAHSYLNHSSI